MFTDIIELVRKEQVSLFIGAGFSLSAGAPRTQTICDAIKKAAIDKVSSQYTKDRLSKINDLSLISKEFLEICNYDRAELNLLLDSLFNFERKDLDDHHLLCRIPNIKRIFTTNYDSLLEDGYGENANVIRNDNDLANIDEKKVNIFKIHGDLVAKENIILTKDDYTSFFSNQKNKGLWSYTLGEFLTHNVLFIGYSLEDENVWTLIEKVREYAPNGSKKIFLIAPQFEEHKLNRLHKLEIIYYDSYASPFLKELYKALCDNMTRDFEKGEVSHAAYSSFLRDNGLRVNTSLGDSTNKVSNVSFTGNRRQTAINIKMTKESFEKLQSRQFSEISIDSPIQGLGCLPRGMVGLELTTSDIKDFNLKMNDVTINDGSNMGRLLILPKVNKVKSKIIVPEDHFRRKVEFSVFPTSSSSQRYTFTNELYQLDINLSLQANTNKIIGDISIRENNRISNLHEALRWCKLLLAIWSGKVVRFKDIIPEDISFGNPEKSTLLRYQLLTKYLENLIRLENEYDVEFQRYDAFTIEKYNLSEALCHYYSDTLMQETLETTMNISCEVSLLENTLPKVGEDYSFTFRKENLQISDFNGFSITIPYAYEIYPSCRVIDISGNESVTKLLLRTNGIEKYYKYSNTPFVLENEEGPINIIEL